MIVDLEKIMFVIYFLILFVIRDFKIILLSYSIGLYFLWLYYIVIWYINYLREVYKDLIGILKLFMFMNS